MKKLTSLFLALIMALSLCVPAMAAEPADVSESAQVGSMDNFTRFNEYMGQFIDVPADSWYASAIENVYEYSLMVGTSDTTFDPESMMSVAQMITIAARMRSIYYDDGATFDRADGEPWYAGYLEYAIEHDIVEDGEFTDYDRPATRMEFAVSIFNALPGEAFTPINRVDDNAIPDVPEGTDGYDAAYTLYRAGVMCGVDDKGTMNAVDVVSRGQVAVIIDRTVNEETRSGDLMLVSSDPDDLYVVPVEEPAEEKPVEDPKPVEDDDKQEQKPVEDDEPVSIGPPRPPVEETPEREPGYGYYDGERLYVNHDAYWVGMSENELLDTMGTTPDTYLESVYDMTWELFNIDTYDGFMAAGVKDGEVVALVAAGKGWQWNGVTWGDVASKEDMYVDRALDGYLNGAMLVDSNDGDKTYGVYLYRYDLRYNSSFDFVTLGGESRLVFHLTNAFRAMHDLNILQWSELAAVTAHSHSQDMADNGYFDHTNLEGQSSGDRMREAGIFWLCSGENIAAGYPDSIECFDGWVNSAGHRDNLLEPSFQNLGVGAYYNDNSEYMCYWTQNFFG